MMPPAANGDCKPKAGQHFRWEAGRKWGMKLVGYGELFVRNMYVWATYPSASSWALHYKYSRERRATRH